jgi:hypothetical protein
MEKAPNESEVQEGLPEEFKHLEALGFTEIRKGFTQTFAKKEGGGWVHLENKQLEKQLVIEGKVEESVQELSERHADSPSLDVNHYEGRGEGWGEELNATNENGRSEKTYVVSATERNVPMYENGFEEVWDFVGDTARVREDGKEFHIGKDGEPLYEERFDEVSTFPEGEDATTAATLNGEQIIINKNGEVVPESVDKNIPNEAEPEVEQEEEPEEISEKTPAEKMETPEVQSLFEKIKKHFR